MDHEILCVLKIHVGILLPDEEILFFSLSTLIGTLDFQSHH